MTRFARAKGSKASNLKAPEDSTPWEVMKEHMLKAKQDNEESKKREEAEQQRIDNYNNFLKEHRVQKRKATWCEFPDDQPSKTLNTNVVHKNEKKKNKKENSVNVTQEEICNESNVDKSKKKKKKNKATIDQTNKCQNNDVSQSETNLASPQNKKTKESSKLQCKDVEIDNTSQSNQTDDANIAQEDVTPTQKNKHKKANKMHNLLNQSNTENKETNNSSFNNTDKKNNHTGDKGAVKKQKKKLKKNEQPNRRKPINDQSFQLIINGKEVELVRYDGFPIMKKDAERLNELKKNMIKKGIPKSEVQRTMKLERRRAEKALARVKREVCYNCRKGGHNLSDCPDLKSNLPGVDAADGLCFKCGSTEHRQFKCKVQRDKEFRFATCFICKESGHIARQCPDNPKGLYPNGGCCKLCGDVTHLRKDCPTVQNSKEETSIKLQTLNDDNIEDIGQQLKPVSQETIKKPKKIKF
ncbi:unnamed protein product, partial [Brenthis ino]